MPQTDRLLQLGIDTAALKGVTQDSREVKAQYLFAALKGEQADGRNYIDAAIARGASVILTDIPYDAPEGVQIVISDNPKRDLSHIAAAFYAPLPEHFVAVTGTNGKSSVVHFAAQLWQKEETRGVMMGTLTGKLTTPDPVTLFKSLSRLKKEEDVTHIAMEVSSHGLSQHRIDGVPVKVAAFTNFTQDHLDYHIDMDSYFAAKTRLFKELLPINGTAVLNADIPSCPALQDICKRRGIRVLSYGENGDDFKLIKRKVVGVAQEVTLEIMGQRYDLTIPFVGEFQVMNMLCALGCLIASTPEDEQRIKTLTEALPTLKGVPGRLQHINDSSGIYNGYVDYAHTPDALETVLNALRPHTAGRLICVFGCGGDRDTTKRPKMGEIAARLADIAIITDDNPRNEDPTLIREQIEAGIPAEYFRHCEEAEPTRQSSATSTDSGLLRSARNDDFELGQKIFNIAGRRAAIEKAVEIMNEGDILLLAGKGHEQGQIIAGEVLPFDDAEELEKTLSNKKSTAKQIERSPEMGK